MFNDKISIIIPAYNVSDYLEQCVLSLERQTYKNIEILIVEDCSTDNTYEICLGLQKTFNNIVVIRHLINCGQEKTRQDGINSASGKWIMFLDGDDTFSLDGIELVTEALLQEPDIVFCPYCKIIDGNVLERRANIPEGEYNVVDFCKDFFVNIPIDYISCIGSKIYRKDFLINNNIHFDIKYKFNEDGGFVYDCLDKSPSIFVSGVLFYQYFIRHTGSIQSSYRYNMFQTISVADQKLKDILSKNSALVGLTYRLFYQKRASVYLLSLENETRFSTYKNYKLVAKRILTDSDYHEARRSVRASNLRMLTIMFWCLSHHFRWLFFISLKVSIFLESRKK